MPLLDCLPQPLTGETLILVIAHPDDEAMFFYPTISRAKRLHIICLSNGGYDGLGEQREEELQRAARRLGASATCINNAALQDGPHAWDPSVVAANVGPWLHARAVVVTFDRYGASGHANHVAVYHGAFSGVGKKTSARRDDAVASHASDSEPRAIDAASSPEPHRLDGEPRRTQASNSSPGQDGTAGSTRSRRRLIIDGTSARWTWRAPPCARALIRGRAGPASLKLRVDGVQGAERVRDTVAAMACGVPRECAILWRRWRAGCRESAHIGPCSSRASTCAAATRRSRRTRPSWSGSGGSSSSSPRTRTRTGSS